MLFCNIVHALCTQLELAAIGGNWWHLRLRLLGNRIGNEKFFTGSVDDGEIILLELKHHPVSSLKALLEAVLS